jgi:hypothetical protein
MTVSMPYIPPNVYLLADNLDAALAAAEDIMKAKLVWETGDARDGTNIARERAEQRKVLETVRMYEQMLVARVLKSRERSEEIAKHDPRFGAVARLYNAGTAMLIEAVGEFGDTTSLDFETGGGAMSYLRSRGLLAGDISGPAEGQTFAFTEDFLVAHRIRLGTLMDLVAMYLDTLETHYDLFSDDVVEPDLLPGETDPAEDAPGLAPSSLAPAEDASDDDVDLALGDGGEDTDSLREALIAVRNMTLDQR